ncbi:LamG-like jellyroll fold domain-containing protein [Piscinibacter sp.]|uniref:LamG-like jellyroll fold domain-containing protein n=1 Tax=Piscinibacter sp. TaxID=1903157 RepID=UPI002B7F11CD|nr:LamG-like jellyroll fold domain-containing protein [Albitalea sp.]HUG22007.1 LamG-like jellyroll fold domain-containing protein [Albitalea sp.]
MPSHDQNDNAGVTRRSFMASLGGTALLGTAGCGGGTDADSSGSTPSANTGGSTPAPDTGSTPDPDSGSSTPDPEPAGEEPEPAPPAPVFLHPGLLHTEADFERMRAKVAAQAEPWTSGWNALTANGRSQLGASPRPLATVIRGGSDQNFAQLYIDVARSYQLALRWKVSGDTRYADLAVTFLNAWSSTLTAIHGNADRFLAAGIYGYQFANAAEIMRTYSGWAPADFARFQKMMLEVFYPLSSHFLVNHNGAEITNYWANWDQCALACVLSVGVLCDREDIYQEALDYYKHGAGNGAGLQAVYHVHPGNLGQWQESGRDQGHCTLGIGLAGAFCEMAWNQGDDLYGYDNSRFLAGAEYVARSNLRDAADAFLAVPYLTNVNKQGTQSALSTAGLGHRRPVWESALHHFEGRIGIAAPHTRRQAAQLRPEGDGGNGDQLGFGTLTFARDAITGGAPRSLRVHRQGLQAVLSWWGTPDAVSYDVKRAATSGGPYTTIATGVVDVPTFNESLAAASGKPFYVVTARTANGESGPSNEVSVSVAPALLMHLAFNDGSGSLAADSTGRWPAAQLVRSDGWTDGRGAGSAVALDGTADHVSLAADIPTELADFTIAAWVHADEARTWARIFDFGSGTRRYMFLTGHSSAGKPRFEITTVHGYNRQVIDGNVALPVGAWAHIAVTLSGGVGTLYLDGQVIGTHPTMTLAPFSLGEGMACWIGKSQFTADPLLKGKIDDFRVYHGALDAAAIAALAAA